jgi:hypothetical protein
MSLVLNPSMDIPDAASLQVEKDSKLFSVLMPNRGRARFLRGVILPFLFFGVVGCLSVGTKVWLEFHARHSWPIAPGQMTAATVKTFTGPSTRDHVYHYYVEYEVRFAVPVEQCRTGTTFVSERDPVACVGTARTRTTNSGALANAWLERYLPNASIEVLHDPNGPGVKIVGEPASIVYPVREIVIVSAWMAIFLICLNITQRRLEYLKTLPEDFDSSQPSPPPPGGNNDLVDLKL